MFENTPLLEVEPAPQAGYTTAYSIYHSDGTYLAKVVGSQIHATEDGKKAGLVLRHLQGVTACEMGSRILFEIRRVDAAALRTHAELYTLLGTFINVTDNAVDWYRQAIQGQQGLRIGTLTMVDVSFKIGTLGYESTNTEE